MRLKNVTFLNSDMRLETRDLSIEDGKISFDFNRDNKENSINCEDYLVIPGLINAHFHSYSPLTKGLTKEMAIQDWCNDSEQGKIQQLFFDYLDNEVAKEDFVYVAQKSYIDMVKNGVTFVSDSDPGDSPELLSHAINEIGIRGIIDTYEEIEDYHSKTNGNVLFGTHLLEEEDITNEELRNLQGVKDKYNPIMMTHCLENQWRFNIVNSKYGKSSVELYNEGNLLDENAVLFHGVFMSGKDMELIAKNGSSVVHCPISNLNTGAGLADVNGMHEKGINVCLGTDYAHTNMWELMRLTYYLLKINNSIDKFSAEDIFRMATINGARAYQLEEDIGEIKEGHKADLVFIKKDSSLNPLIAEENFSTYLHNVLFYSEEYFVQNVMVDGEWIMKERKLMTVNEEKIENKYNKILKGFSTYLEEHSR
ncbi:amidohydrolase family protein [Halobacillus amylolyticus]|uniref:Amidohydrolase family protein n=1 Tax=Halobacillus amylolyticus TaxID=2932259 RepID=A0ABY4HDT6_9BACI|nr:amidohydrolase family protein [Halobacillus amylolyticus]UOR12884.1 amidohydrolase family protein [Halobacillus amylolyticus]